MRRLLWIVIALLLQTLHGAAWAHKPSDSYLTLRANEGSSNIAVRWDIALRDLDYVLQLDRDSNGEINWGEVRQRSEDITRLATSRLELRSAGQPCSWATAAPLMLDHHSDGTYAVLSLTARCGSLSPDSGGLKARYSLLFDVDPSHRGLVQWIGPGTENAQALVFGTESAEQSMALQPTGVCAGRDEEQSAD